MRVAVLALALAISTACAPDGAIRGRVRLGDETALEGLAVSVVGTSNATTVTAADGSFSFEALDPGPYAVLVSAPHTREGSRTAMAVVAEAPVTLEPFELTPLGVVTGRATPGDGGPAAGTLVVAAGSDASASTDADGRYVLRGVPAGERTIIAVRAGSLTATARVAVRWKATVEAPALVVTDRREGRATIEGRVALAGDEPADGIAVSLTGDGLALVARTGSNGAFRFERLPAGTYALEAAVAATAERLRRVDVTVADGAIAAVDELLFTPVGDVEGTITLAGETSHGGVSVYLLDGAGGAVTDALGYYRLRDVPLGPRSLEAFRPGFDAARVNSPAVLRGELVRAENVVLSRAAAGAMDGTATLLGHDTHAGTRASLPGDGMSAVTDAQGRFSIPRVVAGIYPLALVNGPFQDRLGVIALPTGAGWMIDGLIQPLRPIELQRGLRVFDTPTQGVVRSVSGGRVAFTLGSRVVVTSLEWDSAVDVPAANASSTITLAPGGDELLFLTEDRLTAAPVAGGARRTLLSGMRANEGFVQSPDGAWVLASSRGLRLVPAAGGDERVLSPPGATLSGAKFTRDSRHAVLVTDGVLGAVELATGDELVLASGVAGGASEFALHADSSRVAFRRGDDLWLGRIGGDAAAIAALMSPRTITFTGDGESVVFFAGGNTLRVHPLAPSGGRELGIAVGSFKVASSGSRLAWLASMTQLRTVDTSRSEDPRVVSLDATRYELSADGRYVVYVEQIGGKSNLWSLDLAADDSEPQLLAAGISPSDAPQLTPEGRRVLFVARDGLPADTLSSVPVAGGAVTPLLRSPRQILWAGPDVVLSWRTGSPSPYRYQDGLWALAVPPAP